jgi:hypothetical protein
MTIIRPATRTSLVRLTGRGGWGNRLSLSFKIIPADQTLRFFSESPTPRRGSLLSLIQMQTNEGDDGGSGMLAGSRPNWKVGFPGWWTAPLSDCYTAGWDGMIYE